KLCPRSTPNTHRPLGEQDYTPGWSRKESVLAANFLAPSQACVGPGTFVWAAGRQPGCGSSSREEFNLRSYCFGMLLTRSRTFTGSVPLYCAIEEISFTPVTIASPRSVSS